MCRDGRLSDRIFPGSKIGRAGGAACQILRCLDGAGWGIFCSRIPVWTLPGAVDQPLTLMRPKFFKKEKKEREEYISRERVRMRD